MTQRVSYTELKRLAAADKAASAESDEAFAAYRRSGFQSEAYNAFEAAAGRASVAHMAYLDACGPSSGTVGVSTLPE